MTEVMFHLNVPDRLGYACRLLRKAHARGAKVVVSAPPATLARLDSCCGLSSRPTSCRTSTSSLARRSRRI